MDINKIKRFGELQDKVYEMTKGEISLVTFYDDTQGINIHNPFFDASGRFRVDPILEYGLEALSHFENAMLKIESDIEMSVFDMTAENLKLYLGAQFYKDKELKSEYFLDIPISNTAPVFLKSEADLPVCDVLRFDIPKFDDMERVFPDAILKYVTPFDNDKSLRLSLWYDIENEGISLHASCKGAEFSVYPAESAYVFLKNNINFTLASMGEKRLEEFALSYVDLEIKDRIIEEAKKGWYIKEDENGCYDIEFSADYTENNQFLLQTVYDNRDSDELSIIITNEIYDSYEETILAYEKELLKNAGFDETSYIYERAEDVLHDTIFFNPDYKHFTKDEVKLNLLIGTDFEKNSDFSDIHDNLKVHADKDLFLELKKEVKENGFEMKEPDNGLKWLIFQQGYTISDLRKVKEAYDAYFKDNQGETYTSYAERYQEFIKMHSPFLTSVCQELADHTSIMGCLTILQKSTFEEYCKMFERNEKDGSLIPKEIIFDKTIKLGIFNPWIGSCSDLEIELEKELVLPNDLVFDTQFEGVILDEGASVNSVCGLIGSCWRECKEIRESKRVQGKESLDEQLKGISNHIKEESARNHKKYSDKER